MNATSSYGSNFALPTHELVRTSFSSLEPEMQQEILKFLPLKDIIATAGTCVTFRTAALFSNTYQAVRLIETIEFLLEESLFKDDFAKLMEIKDALPNEYQILNISGNCKKKLVHLLETLFRKFN